MWLNMHTRKCLHVLNTRRRGDESIDQIGK
jgi:hypothetical protein